MSNTTFILLFLLFDVSWPNLNNQLSCLSNQQEPLFHPKPLHMPNKNFGMTFGK